MDRVRAQSVIGGGAMRVGGIGAFDVLLRAGGQERRELEVDAGDRRAVPQAAVLRLAADDGLARGVGVGSQREAGGTVDAGDGIAGDFTGTAHLAAPSRASDLPVLAAGYGSPAAQSGLVLRHHVRADAAWVFVSGGGDGLVQSLRAGLGVVEHLGGAVLCRGVGEGAGDRAAGDFQHRPGGAVYQRGVHRQTSGCRDTDQHGRKGSGAGQRDGGAVVAQCEVRGDLSVGLCQWHGGLAGIESVFSVLQHRATASRVGQKNAGRGLLRVRRGGYPDMALGQIVAYKRLWRENLIDGETQIPRSERNSQGARISGDRFTSLFEVKNCPTNGGKLTPHRPSWCLHRLRKDSRPLISPEKVKCSGILASGKRASKDDGVLLLETVNISLQMRVFRI